MNIKRVIVGSLRENCYILEKDGKVIIVDPGDEIEKIRKEINGEVVGVLITHKHFDHIGALKFFKENIYSFDNTEEKEYKINSFVFDVIRTPGHSNDSISFYFKEDNILFSGDFIFHESIGRTDLNGSERDMKKSIIRIKSYPKDMVIYPGHGRSTTLEHEMVNNVYFRGR